jgi:hypothetical protein
MSIYDDTILGDEPVAYYAMGTVGWESDVLGTSPPGQYHGSCIGTLMPNDDWATVFEGMNGYLSIPDMSTFSPATTGVLTVEAWLRPDTLRVPMPQGSGYCHWLSKTAPDANEWALRYYSRENSETPPRPNHISGYAYNPAGGLGAGSRIQDPVTPGEWIHVALVIDTTDVGIGHVTGRTRIYRNGMLRDLDALSSYSIVPVHTAAPVRVGYRLVGAVGKVAFYDRALPAERLLAHHQAMVGGAP